MTKNIKRVGWYDPDTHKTRRGLPEKHMEAFYKELDRVRAMFFEKDEDGDYPVSINVDDRTRTSRNYYTPMIHTMKATEDEIMEALGDAIGNVRQAADELRILQFEVRRINQKRKGKSEQT